MYIRQISFHTHAGSQHQYQATSFGWKGNGKGRYGSFHYRMYAGCAGKTVRFLENVCAIEVCSRQGAIQIHIYLYLYLHSKKYYYHYCCCCCCIYITLL